MAGGGAAGAEKGALHRGFLATLNVVNNLAHMPVVEDLLWYGYWVGALLLAPLLVPLLLLRLGYEWYMGQVLPKLEAPVAGKGILITGCDTGFGHGLAIELAQKGWRVYAGCLTEGGIAGLKGKGIATLVPIELNVVKAEHIEAAVALIERECPGGMYALVNNAGVGMATVIDWTPIEAYRRIMEINFFALVSVTKACLPLLKRAKGRIINITSIAGLYLGLPFMSAYSASKHAAEAFSTSLRFEMQGWGIKVVTVNPSFHRTAIATGAVSTLKPAFDKLGEDTKAEYGVEYLRACEALTDRMTEGSWDPENVVRSLVVATTASAPRAQYVIGLDAKYELTPCMALPNWVGEGVIGHVYLKGIVPKAMQHDKQA